MRRASRVDANHSAIRDALAACGATCISLAGLGSGVPDILCGWRGRNLLIECKDGSKSASRRRLTPDQVGFHAAWRGEIHVVETVNAALALLKVRDA